jgi:hypothetical protein
MARSHQQSARSHPKRGISHPNDQISSPVGQISSKTVRSHPKRGISYPNGQISSTIGRSPPHGLDKAKNQGKREKGGTFSAIFEFSYRAEGDRFEQICRGIEKIFVGVVSFIF